MPGKKKGDDPVDKLKSCVRSGLQKDPKASVPTLAKSCAKQLGIKIKLKKK